MKTVEELKSAWKEAMDATQKARKTHDAVEQALLPLQLESHRAFEAYMAAMAVEQAAFDALFEARKAASVDSVGDA